MPSPAESLAAPALLDRFAAIVGAKHVLTDPGDTIAYLIEPRDLYQGRALCVLRPGSVAEVAALVALCNATGTPLVPQGGNTGLVGGSIPDASGTEVLITLKRLDRVREVDVLSNTMTVEAGVTLTDAQAAAERAGRLFPLSLPSEGSCTIGGNLSTNAGGTAALAYGTARDLVSGLEVVLADGRVLSVLSKLKKDNTGYDLKHLFMGAEGTLGIITAAVLKLFPRPRAVETAFIGLADPHKALALLDLALGMAGGDVKSFELMPRIGIDFVLKHASGVREPLAGRHNWYVLLELSSLLDEGLAQTMLALLERAAEEGLIEDAAIAASLDQRTTFWRLREMLAESPKYEGGSIKHDVSVPVARVPDFLDAAIAAVIARIPGARPVPFGHMGDGNIHFNVSQPEGADKAAFLARWREVNELVHAIVAKYEGSISAEHGIGVLKRDLLPGVKDPVAMDVMRLLKHTLDPNNILNPGKVL
jgi:FAD/FMN-containing dehydrogenase